MTQIRTHARTQETDEVLRRIGRNVVNFQHVEYLLKRLASMQVPTGPASDTAARMTQHVEKVGNTTMGTLAIKVKASALSPQAEKYVPEVIEEPWIGFQFSISENAEFVDQYDRQMQALVESRNHLIHHFLPEWHRAVEGDVAGAIEYLDLQNTKAMSMMEKLQGWVASMEECRRLTAEILASPDMGRQFELMHLRGSRLVAMLSEIALRTAHNDGWAFFTTAANLIHREAPEELKDLHARYGLKSLREVLMASGLFDVRDETLPEGRTRLLYRINDRYSLNAQPSV